MSSITKRKTVWFASVLTYFLVGYYILNFFNLSRSYYVDVSFSFERDIPFVPVAIFGYLLVFVSILCLYLFVDSERFLKRSAYTMLAVITVHFLLFALVPVKMTFRPDLSASEGLFERLTYYYYVIDNPTNLFPSLHVAFPTAAACLTWNERKQHRLMMVLFAVIVAVSVVFVKQHYIADAIVGAVVAFSIYYGIKKSPLSS